MNRRERRRLVATGEKHEALRQELLAIVRRYTDDHDLPSDEVLAITANIVGMCIALQNQMTMTQERAMQIVVRNIELGNQTVINDLTNRTAGQA